MRGRTILLSLGLLLLCAGFAVLTLHSVSADSPEIAQVPVMRQQVVWFQGLPEATRWSAAAAGAASLIVGLLLLLYGGRGNQGRRICVADEPTGRVTVSLDGLQRMATHVIRRVPGVEVASAEVAPARGRVHFKCRVGVAPSSSVAEVAHLVREQLGEAMERHIGQPAAETRIDLDTQVYLPSGRRRTIT